MFLYVTLKFLIPSLGLFLTYETKLVINHAVYFAEPILNISPRAW